jgi:predicted metal-dependent phosphoesterase TrpH
MKIDLHIHSKNCSDGRFSIYQIIKEAKRRKINLLSITDHDSVACQEEAINLAKKTDLDYITGIELNITFSCPDFNNGKPVSLDLLGYNFNPNNKELRKKLTEINNYRNDRAEKILKKINIEFRKETIQELTKHDLSAIQNSADGCIGRPHIADYLINKGIVKNRKEAFNKYLVKCNVPKYPIFLNEASNLLKKSGGLVVLAHPNDPYGTSLVKFSKSLHKQTMIIKKHMLDYIDGIECWHSRNNLQTTNHYVTFSKRQNLIMTGGSDCHQNPIIMGTVKIPNFVAKQFQI